MRSVREVQPHVFVEYTIRPENAESNRPGSVIFLARGLFPAVHCTRLMMMILGLAFIDSK